MDLDEESLPGSPPPPPPPSQNSAENNEGDEWPTLAAAHSLTGIELTNSASTTMPVISTAYSPVGMVLHELARLPTGVEPLLRDRRGIFHYHRPATRLALARPHSHALHQVIRRITLGNAAQPAPIGHDDSAVHAQRRRRPPLVGRWLTMGSSQPAARTASVQVVGSNATVDECEWVSDHSESEPGRDFSSTLLRIRARAEARRRRGVSKPLKRGPAARTTQQSLAVAYGRYQTDEQAIMRTVTEMGQGDADTILQMIRGGISVDVTDSARRTPLHVASSCGNADGMRLLLHMGATPNVKDRIGNTPLTLAATGARADIVIALLEAGADPRMGNGLLSAVSMVRARLRLLRARIRQERQAEKELGVEDAQKARERRVRSAAVARECVEIITLLRHYAKNPREEYTNPAYDAFVASGPDAEPASLLHGEADALDELAAQLTTMGLEGRPASGAPTVAADKGKAAETSADGSDFAAGDADATGGSGSASTAAASCEEEEQMDDLLDRFAQLLGDDDKT